MWSLPASLGGRDQWCFDQPGDDEVAADQYAVAGDEHRLVCIRTQKQYPVDGMRQTSLVELDEHGLPCPYMVFRYLTSVMKGMTHGAQRNQVRLAIPTTFANPVEMVGIEDYHVAACRVGATIARF